MSQSNRRREKYCADKLFQFLTEAGITCEYSRGPDPPDFIFNVDSDRWAVEHTRLEERVQGAKRAISREHCTQADFQVVERLRERLGDNVNGEWYLKIQGPLQKKDRYFIEAAAYKAISEANEDLFRDILIQSSPGLIDQLYNDDLVTLDRTAKTGSFICCGSGLAFGSKIPDSNKSVSDILAVNTDSVNSMIQRKKPKLLKMQDQYDLIVLLLESHLTFGDHRRIHEIMKQKEDDLKWVDKVYLVYEGNIAQVL